VEIIPKLLLRLIVWNILIIETLIM